MDEYFKLEEKLKGQNRVASKRYLFLNYSQEELKKLVSFVFENHRKFSLDFVLQIDFVKDFLNRGV